MHMDTELPGKRTREQGVSTKELQLALELWENFKSIFSGGLPLPIPLRRQRIILTKTYLFIQLNSLSTYSLNPDNTPMAGSCAACSLCGPREGSEILPCL